MGCSRMLGFVHALLCSGWGRGGSQRAHDALDSKQRTPAACQSRAKLYEYRITDLDDARSGGTMISVGCWGSAPSTACKCGAASDDETTRRVLISVRAQRTATPQSTPTCTRVGIGHPGLSRMRNPHIILKIAKAK